MSSKLVQEDFSYLLRENGFKATPARLLVLSVLTLADHPLTTQEILHELGGRVDQATVYRTLESLLAVAVIRQIDMQHGHAHFELRSGKAHHHHLICRSCGLTEDVPNCDTVAIEKSVLKRSKTFSSIDEHALEFFGFCTKCVRQLNK